MNERNKLEQNEELKYARFNHAIVHISEVISGLNSGAYQCPKCRSLLIAKKGDVRIHHFAHYNYEQCQGAQETALHQLAKEILLQEKILAIPDINNSERLVFLEFDEMNQEVRLLTMVVDVLGVYGSNTLAIEVKVTHEVDLRKASIVKENAIDMIEIDLSSYINANLSRQELMNAVIENAPRYWINTQTKKEEMNMINQVKVIGFKSYYGSMRGNNYDKKQLYVMQPIEKKNMRDYTVTACAGYEMIKLDLDDNRTLFNKLEGFEFPCDVVLKIDTKVKGNQLVPIVVDADLI